MDYKSASADVFSTRERVQGIRSEKDAENIAYRILSFPGAELSVCATATARQDIN